MPQQIELVITWKENAEAELRYLFHNNRAKQHGQTGVRKIVAQYTVAASPIHFVAAGLEFIGVKLTELKATVSIDGAKPFVLAANKEGASHYWKIVGAP